MKKILNSTLSLIAICAVIFLTTCSSSTSLPADAERALDDYWQSLPSYPNITYQIHQAWPGISAADGASGREVWCVETEIAAAENASIVGERLTWIVIRNNEGADWVAALLATMSSTWPYEACGNGP